MIRDGEASERTRTYSRSSGADLSATQARVNAWRSRVSWGTVLKVGSTSRSMSSISMLAELEAVFNGAVACLRKRQCTLRADRINVLFFLGLGLA